MILDQPTETEATPAKRKRSWFEIIMVTTLLSLTVAREITGNLVIYSFIGFTAVILAAGYFFAYYWINKPIEKNPRTVCLTILYGLTFASATFSFAALIMFTPGTREASLLTLSLFAATLLLDFIGKRKGSWVINTQSWVRASAYAVILTTLTLIPERAHVCFTYRRYPNFIAYYKLHQKDGEFLRIFWEFQAGKGELN